MGSMDVAMCEVVIHLQWNLASSRIQSFAGLKNIQKLKISKNIKFKLEITFKDELQKTSFNA